MEIGSATSATALQTALAALAEAAGAAEPGGEPGATGGVGGLLQEAGAGLSHAAAAAVTAGAVAAPGSADAATQAGDAAAHRTPAGQAERTDAGARSAALQATAPPRSSPNDVPAAPAGLPPVADATSAAASAGSAPLAAEPMVAATLIGLQIEPGWAWGLQRRGFEPSVAESPAAARGDAWNGSAHEGQDEPEPEADEPAAADSATAADAPEAPTRGPNALKVEPWAAPLTRALREALAAPAPPASLRAAAEQWRLGRCVVLAFPRGDDAAAAAWAFVLWPRPGGRSAARLALFGLRVDARLSWQRLPPGIDWCHARAVKTHHPRQGRQLAAVAADASQAVPCELQLGPVRPQAPRWREACVRVDAVRRFWAALGEQWSVTLVVGSRPFAGLQPASANPAAREPAC